MDRMDNLLHASALEGTQSQAVERSAIPINNAVSVCSKP